MTRGKHSAKRIWLVATALLMVFNCMSTQAQSPIARQDLEQMFENITRDTKWDMSHDMLWGYFFTNKTRQPLESAAKELSALGYRMVDIHLGDKEEASVPDVWWLHVERVETHSVESLHTRNIELSAFAKKLGLQSYDGMDVGPVKGGKS